MARRQPIPGVGAHARDRMRERLGRDLSREEWLAAVESIIERRATLLCSTPCGSEHYLHGIGGIALRLVWRPSFGLIVTVLPAEAPQTALVARVTRNSRIRKTFTRSPWKGGQRTARRTVWVTE